MVKLDKKVLIIGAGGFGRDVLIALKTTLSKVDTGLDQRFFFMETKAFQANCKVINGAPILVEEDFNPEDFQVVVAIANPALRSKIVKDLPHDTVYFSFIHPAAILSDWVSLGQGSVVTAGCILTTDIKIGNHAHLNFNTTIGHDCLIGDFLTTAPAVNISGNCKIGNRVYIGTNAAIKQGLTIVDDVTIGMGAVVIRDILEPGVYVGNPARKLPNDLN